MVRPELSQESPVANGRHQIIVERDLSSLESALLSQGHLDAPKSVPGWAL